MSNLTSLQSIDFGQWCFNGASLFSLIGIIERMDWEIDLPLLQSVKMGYSALRNTKSFAMSNLTSLVSIEFGGDCFNGASSFSLIGIIEWMKWEIDLPLLQSVKLGNEAFRYTKSFAMSNLTSLVSIDIGQWCFGGDNRNEGASSFSLIGIIERMKWGIDLLLLQSVKLGGGAFSDTKSFAMSNLTSLQSIEFGGGCFYYASSFSLIGRIEWMKWEIDLPRLQSIKLGDGAFRRTESFAMSNLTSLQSIEFGKRCFGGTYDENKRVWIGGASSFSLIGKTEIKNRCLDLPQLQSIRLNEGTFIGDSNRRLSEEYPFKYNNTMIMRSRIDWEMEWNRSPVADVIHGKW